MAIEVEAPDGTVIEFPEGTPDTTIANVMGANYGVMVPGPDGQPVLKKLPSVAPTERTLTERFMENRDDAFRRGSLAGSGADALAATVLGPAERQRNADDAALYAIHSAADPWYRARGGVVGKALAGAATLGGQLGGSAASPESWIAPGRSLFGKMIGQAAVAGLTDPVVQGLSNVSGAEQGYDPMRTASSAALGGLLPVGFEAAGHLGSLAYKPFKPIVDPIFAGLRDAMPSNPLGPDWWNTPEPKAPEAPRASRSTHPASPPENTVSRDPVTGDWIIDVNTSTNPEFEAQQAHRASAPAPAEPSTWTPEREAAFLATHGAQPPDAPVAVGAEGYPPVPVPSPKPETVTRPVAVPETAAPPKRERATYLAPDGFPTTTAPAALPGHYVVRAEPDGTHTLINRTAGWSPVASGLDRDTAMARWKAAEDAAAPPAPPATARAPTPAAEQYVPLPDHETIDLPGKKGRSPVASISLHQREDGTWASGYDYTLPSSGGASPNDGHFATRDDAVAAAAAQLRGRIAPFSTDTGVDAALKGKINGWLDQTAPAAPEARTAPSEPIAPEDAAWLPEDAPAAPVAQRDPTDDALDLLRAGKHVRVDQGPPLAHFIARNGALAPSPELSAIDAEKWHRSQNPFTPRLVREGGQSLETMAQRAYEAGYFPEIAPPTMAGHENMQAVSGSDLVEALRRELAGQPRYASDANPEAADLARHADELEQMLHELGLDPARMSNPEIKKALTDYFNAPDPDRPLHLNEPTAAERVRLADGDAMQGLIPGVERPTTADEIAAEQARRARRGGNDVMPENGLFDETAKSQPGLFEPPAPPPESSMVPTARTINGRSVTFPDAAHAALYDFGRDLHAGADGKGIDAAADKLRRSIGRYMDWSEDLDANPLLRSRFEGDGSIPPRKLIYRAAREYAAGVERDPSLASISMYDPERANELLHESGVGVKLQSRTGGKPPKGELSLAEQVKAVLVDARRRGVPAEFRGIGPSGPILTGFEGRWPEAVRALHTLGRGDAVGVLSHPEVGPIDVVWGDKNSGLAHIMADPRRAEMVRDLPRLLADTERLPEGRTRAILESDTHRFVVALNHFGGEKRWLLTGYERKGQSGGGRIDSAAHEDPAVAAREGSPDRLDNPNIATDEGDGKHQSLAVSRRGRPVFTGNRTAEPGKANHSAETLHTLAVRLKKALGVPVRRGRIAGGKKVLGTYDTSNTVIRLREAMEEFNTFAHEQGHATEYLKIPALVAALRKHAADLRPLAYPGAPKGKLRIEGFAEWYRWYLTNPEYARKVAPAFYDAFEKAVGDARPKLLADLQGIQKAYQDVLAAPSANLASASLVRMHKGAIQKITAAFKEDGVAGVASNIANSAYRGLADELNPIAQVVKMAEAIYRETHGKKLDLKAAENPYVWARISKDAYSAGHTDIMHGVVPDRGVAPEGPGLTDALEKAFGPKGRFPGDKFDENLLDDFGAYLLSRRNIGDFERYEAGQMDRPPDQYSLEHWQAVRDDFEAKHPTWADAASLIHEWNANLWRKRFEAGLITEDTYKEGLKIKDYVPAHRDMSGGPSTGNAKTTGDLQYAGGAKHRAGSDRPYLNPIQVMMREAYELSALRFRNEAYRTLADLATKAGPRAGAIMERLPTKELRGVNVDVSEALEDAAKRAGLSVRDTANLVSDVETALMGDTTATVYRPGEINLRNEPIVFVWRDGVKEAWRLPDGKLGSELYTALTGITNEAHNLFIDIASAPSQALRYGITSHPKFMLTNYVRDQLTAWINAEGFTPVVSGAHGVGLELRQGETVHRYAAFAGAMGGANVAALPHTRVSKNMQELRSRGVRIRQIASWNGFAHLSEITETGTRLGVFRAAEKRALKDGMSPFEAAVEGSMTARDYVDFGLAGRWVKHIGANRIVTFMNAGIQSIGKAARVATAGGKAPQIIRDLMRAEPLTRSEKRAAIHAAKWWAKVSALGVMGLTLRAIYADEPEYQEVSDYLRDTHWIIGTPTTDTVSGWRWYAIPKPFELAAVSNIMERGYEAYALHDPTAWHRLRAGLWNILVPPHEIPALSVPFQVAANRDSSGKPIIPDYLKGKVDPQLEVNSYTSAIAKKMGAMFNWSPAVVDHVLSGVLGYWGKDIQGASNLVDEAFNPKTRKTPALEDGYLTGRFVRDPARGSTSQKEFYDLVAEDGGKYTRTVGTVQAMIRDGREDEIADYLARLDPPERSYVAAQVFGSTLQKAVQPLVRAQDVTKVLGGVRRQARDGQLADIATGPIRLNPDQLQKVDSALATLIMAEQRDALIASGVKGWDQKEPIDTVAAIKALKSINPAILSVIDASMAAEKVLPPSTASIGWDQARPILEGEPPAQAIDALAVHKRTRTHTGKLHEAQRRMLQ